MPKRTKVVHSRTESVRLVAVPDELVRRLAKTAWIWQSDRPFMYCYVRLKQIIEDYTKEKQK